MTVEEAAKVLRAVFVGMSGGPARYTERIVRHLVQDFGAHLVIAAAHQMNQGDDPAYRLSHYNARRTIEWAESELASLAAQEGPIKGAP